MPAFAFAYGSFGDILATGQLIVKIIVNLRRGTRSDECAETEKELKSLGGDLANLTSCRWTTRFKLRHLRNAVVNGVNLITQQLATYQQQIVAVVRQVSRGVVEDLFVVISPAGVSIPVPLAYCDAFLAYFKPETDGGGVVYWLIIPSSDGSEFPERPSVSMELVLVSRPEDSVLTDVWYRSYCAWCGNPFAILSEQSLKCRIRPNSRCASVAQLFNQVSRQAFPLMLLYSFGHRYLATERRRHRILKQAVTDAVDLSPRRTHRKRISALRLSSDTTDTLPEYFQRDLADADD
ncbi:hypothetical protein B0H16DRAFT_1890952 [Mycena metata]|uniref:Uncharacterized protein n=1 Tax=Mycena metata TaxID=1033252 RepID=A0AAD7ICF0_9AGAR|nr:hypothetical protein B0H16DRAFT_1890952 [Mycena metata]